MKPRKKLAFPGLGVALALVAGLGAASAARAGDMKAQLDFGAKLPMLDKQFSRYGYAPTKSIARDNLGIRFRLPADTKGVEQTGLYSYFALAGDFEITATYELLSVAAPQRGYGVSCGIAVDAKGSDLCVALTRSLLPDKRIGYAVTVGKKIDDQMTYDMPHFAPSQAKSGKLMLRREKAEVVCLVADKPGDEPQEIYRTPFTDGTVRQLRIYADAGGAPTKVDARISKVQVRAEEITGGIPVHESGSRIWWWLTVLALVAAAAIGYVVYRRHRQED